MAVIKNGRCYRQAFTLIEMTAVLVIVAVMAAVVAPNVEYFYQNAILNSTVQRFRTLLEAARIQSALNHTEYRIIIQPGWRRIDMETAAIRLIKNPSMAVAFIKEEDSLRKRTRDGITAFSRADGEFSGIDLSGTVNIKYISVDGRQKVPFQEIVVTFSGFSRADEVDFVFENGRKEYLGLQLEGGTGAVRDLKVNNRDR